MRRYNKRDANEPELLKIAAQLGARWYESPPLDGWVFWRGQWRPVEIKLPEREGQKYEYTPKQKRFFAFCLAVGTKPLTWRTEQDVLDDLAGRRTA